MSKLPRMLISVMTLVICFHTSTMPTQAIDNATISYVDILNSYGFFKGTETGYELERAPTRIEALVMIIRLTNNEQWALNENWDKIGAHGFTDVPEWADGYVSCAKKCGLVNGIGETEFGSDEPINAEQFITLLLRILDYSDDFHHFSWDNPWNLANHIGLSEDLNSQSVFTRGDMAYLSYKALSTNMKNSQYSLYYYYFIYKKPPVEIGDNQAFLSTEKNIRIDKFDSIKTLKAGDTAYSSVNFEAVESGLLIINNTNPTVAVYKIDYSDDNGTSADITVEGLKTGHTTLTIVYPDNEQAPHAIGLIDIFVE